MQVLVAISVLFAGVSVDVACTVGDLCLLQKCVYKRLFTKVGFKRKLVKCQQRFAFQEEVGDVLLVRK